MHLLGKIVNLVSALFQDKKWDELKYNIKTKTKLFV